MTTDLKANNYVLFNSYVYQKPGAVKNILRKLLGSGACSGIFADDLVFSHYCMQDF